MPSVVWVNGHIATFCKIVLLSSRTPAGAVSILRDQAVIENKQRKTVFGFFRFGYVHDAAYFQISGSIKNGVFCVLFFLTDNFLDLKISAAEVFGSLVFNKKLRSRKFRRYINVFF